MFYTKFGILKYWGSQLFIVVGVIFGILEVATYKFWA